MGEINKLTLAAQKLINLNNMTDEQEFLVYQNAVMASLNDSWKKLKLCVTEPISGRRRGRLP